ncbi:MAG TPA: DUF2092 domain-containing protein, partial [Roseiarcus sp.]|nr:DUF2092 domain-containing protein [Roseiarcus sp.]
MLQSTERLSRPQRVLRTTASLAALLAMCFFAPLALAQTQGAQAPVAAEAPPLLEPKAIDVLKAASAALAGAKTLSFTAISTYERAANNGQPLYYSTLSEVTVQRPDKLKVITLGDGTPDEFYYDGKTMMAYVPGSELVAVAEAPPTIDQL